MTTITIVTPWLAHPELADDYLAAVKPELHAGDDVLIVDNGDAPDLPFTTLCPDANLGFAGGSNLGLNMAKTDVVLFLNNDIAPKETGWLDHIRYWVRPLTLVGQLRDGWHTEVDGQRLPYLDGWCLAGMRADLLQLGGFDERLQEPAYFSDNLLCLEARAAGMTLRALSSIGLHHKENVTAGHYATPAVRRAHVANQARYLERARDLLVTT